jgi:hypothetical protein
LGDQAAGELLKAGLLVGYSGGADYGFASEIQLRDFDGLALARGAE